MLFIFINQMVIVYNVNCNFFTLFSTITCVSVCDYVLHVCVFVCVCVHKIIINNVSVMSHDLIKWFL